MSFFQKKGDRKAPEIAATGTILQDEIRLHFVGTLIPEKDQQHIASALEKAVQLSLTDREERPSEYLKRATQAEELTTFLSSKGYQFNFKEDGTFTITAQSLAKLRFQEDSKELQNILDSRKKGGAKQPTQRPGTPIPTFQQQTGTILQEQITNPSTVVALTV